MSILDVLIRLQIAIWLFRVHPSYYYVSIANRPFGFVSSVDPNISPTLPMKPNDIPIRILALDFYAMSLSSRQMHRYFENFIRRVTWSHYWLCNMARHNFNWDVDDTATVLLLDRSNRNVPNQIWIFKEFNVSNIKSIVDIDRFNTPMLWK